MNDHLGVHEAAQACSVSVDTIKRRLRQGQFPKATRGAPTGHRLGSWLIPIEDLAAAGLKPFWSAHGTPDPSEGEVTDQVVLRVELAHYRALAEASVVHLADLRSEIRRLHQQVDLLVREGVIRPEK